MQWVARYTDGSELPQYNGDGSENKYADIDRTRLQTFGLFDDRARLVIAVHFDEPGKRLIYRRRIEQRSGFDPVTVCLVGWQQTVAGHNVQSIQYVFPDGTIHSAGAWNEQHPWFYAPELLPQEV